MQKPAAAEKAFSADVDSLLVVWKYGKVSCVLLTRTDRSTCEVRGAPMWRLLNELSLLWRRRPMREHLPSLQTSKGYVRNDRQAHFAWEGPEGNEVVLGRSPVPGDRGTDRR